MISLLNETIKQNGLEEFIEEKFLGCFEKSFYAKKILDIIIYRFPERLSEEEIAKQLNICPRWIQHEIKKAFKTTYKKIARIIWFYQAVLLLTKTELDK